MVILNVPSFSAILMFGKRQKSHSVEFGELGGCRITVCFYQEIQTQSSMNKCVVRWINQPSGVMKWRNLTSNDVLNRQLWRLKTSDWWTTGKLIYIYFTILDLIHIIGAHIYMYIGKCTYRYIRIPACSHACSHRELE